MGEQQLNSLPLIRNCFFTVDAVPSLSLIAWVSDLLFHKYLWYLDINECTEGSHGCHRDATCQNTVGSYRCTCNSQYIGDGLNCEPKECSNYKTLTSARRLKGSKSKKPYVCDNSLTWGWYRITGAADRKMPTSCVPFQRCGGQRPGWLSGGHPNKADGRVSRKVWFRSSDNCYRVSRTITVRNCGSFYVYYLKGFSHGSNCHRYCSSY